MFLISFSNIPGNYFLIPQPIVFLYERGLHIYIICFIYLISFLCELFIILNLPAGVLLIPWLWFFALYCRNSNVQYQGPFKVRPWISERRQSFPILSQTQNWHNWSNNSSYTTLSHARQKVSKSRTAMQCIYGDVGELWALSWQITLGTLQCTKAITWRKVKRKRASGVITRGYHCRFGTGWIFARSRLSLRLTLKIVR